MARRKQASKASLLNLALILGFWLYPPDWKDATVQKVLHAAFALSFGLFNMMCFIIKQRVHAANDQRVIRVPTVDGKGTEPKSVREYDNDQTDSLMVRGTLVRHTLWAGQPLWERGQRVPCPFPRGRTELLLCCSSRMPPDDMCFSL
jgi:hypothetical protein